MSKGAIKTGRYTHELRSRNILEVKRLEQQNSGGVLAYAESGQHSPMDFYDVVDARLDMPPSKMMILDETLAVLVAAQRFLHEFIDSYYEEDLMLNRQRNVYVSKCL